MFWYSDHIFDHFISVYLQKLHSQCSTESQTSQRGSQCCSLTYGRDHRDGEVKRPGEFPLHPGFVRLQLQHHLLQLVKVLLRQVERLDQLRFSLVHLPPLGRFLLGFQRVKDRRADYQIGEGADDEGEGPHVLPLHGGAACVRGTGGVSALVWRTGSSAGSWLSCSDGAEKLSDYFMSRGAVHSAPPLSPSPPTTGIPPPSIHLSLPYLPLFLILQQLMEDVLCVFQLNPHCKILCEHVSFGCMCHILAAVVWRLFTCGPEGSIKSCMQNFTY